MNICTNPTYWAEALNLAKFIALCVSVCMFPVYALIGNPEACDKHLVPIYVWVILVMVHLLGVLGLIFIPSETTVIAMCH